jgi:serine phosphatase RsbU (regulator of sigma subunit)
MNKSGRILALEALAGESPERPELHPRVLQGVLWAAAGGTIALLLDRLLGHGSVLAVWGVALAGGWAWYETIRLLLLRSRLPRFWTIWTGLGVPIILLAGSGSAGYILGIVLSSFFLLLRTYRPYRELAGAGRALTALIGFAALMLLPWGTGFEPSGWLSGVGNALALWTTWSLRLFWIATLLHLFFRMRLHFLHLKPKLAVTGFFLAGVPLLLLGVLALLFLWGTAGGERTKNAAETIRTALGVPTDTEWGLPFQRSEAFTVTLAAGEVPPAGLRTRWLPRLVEMLHHPAPPDTIALDPRLQRLREEGGGPGMVLSLSDSSEWRENIGGAVWSPADTSALFMAGQELWAIRVTGLGSDRLHLEGRRLDDEALQRLALLVETELSLEGVGYLLTGQSGSQTRQSGRPTALPEGRPDSMRVPFQIRGRLPSRPGALDSMRFSTRYSGSDSMRFPSRYSGPDSMRFPPRYSGPDSMRFPAGDRSRAPGPVAAPDSTVALVDRPLWFGMSRLAVLRLRTDRFEVGTMVLLAHRSAAQFVDDFLSGTDQVNRVFVYVVGFIAVLFLVVELAALFLGVRITGGITGAVAELFRGTRRIAEGDLDTRILIPNQDEFGELARSFNRMAAAVKQGREEAVARERLEQELDTARSIQESLLPHRMPVVPGFEVAASSVPSRQVGGDYFDFVDLADGRLGVVIGDVSGKGIPAALLMANLQATLQGQVIHPGTVAQTMGRINDLMVRASGTAMYATFFYGVLDRITGTFAYSNAGHEPPLLLRSNGTLDRLEVGGIPIGMLPGAVWEEARATIGAGDLLVLFTDGITEAMGPMVLPVGSLPGGGDGADEEEDPEPDFFGSERLIEMVRGCAGKTALEVRDAILAAVATFTRGEPQSDDMTLVVLRHRGEGL